MGNNNATASLTESSKLATNGISPLENAPVETTQDQVFLAVEGKDGDKQSESFSDDVTGKESQETEPESNVLVDDPKVTKVEEDICHNGMVMETYEQLHKTISVAEGVETVCESEKVEELSMKCKLNTEESGNEEKPCVSDEVLFVSQGLYETSGTEEKLVMNESLEETAPGGEAVKLDQEICMEQRTGSTEEAQEILNLENCVLDDEVTNEGKTDKEIPKLGSQETEAAVLEIGFEVSKEERDMELQREASLKRMSRCRSLPVSHNSRVMGDLLVQELVSKVTSPSRNKLDVDKANTSDILPVSCLTINTVQEALKESSKEARLDMRSPSFSNDLKTEESRVESIEETPDKTEAYNETLDVEEKTVMLKRSETEKMRGFELSLGLSMNLSARRDTDDSFTETKSAGDYLVEEKPNMSETLLVSWVGSNKAQDTNEVITESNKGDARSLSFGNDLRTKDRSDQSTEDKTQIYKTTLDVEEKTVMLKRSETEKIRGFELSLGLSMNLSGRCDRDRSFEETKGSGDNLVDKKDNTSETLFVSCVGSSNKAQDATEVITESNKEDLLEMRSPSSGNDLRTKARSGESTEHIPLLCQDKTEEKKTVMLKRSDSEKTRGFGLSLGLLIKPGERSEADDSLKENKDTGDNLLEKKASWGSMKGRVRKRSKSSLFGTCLCCNIAMN